LKAFILGVFVLLAIIAAWTGLGTMKETLVYIDNFTKALANLYKGAFAQ